MRERKNERVEKKKKTRGRQRRREECRKLRAPYVLADDMRGNELSDFMHQKRDTRHRLDCQRFLSRIREMSSHPPSPYNLPPSTLHQLSTLAALT